MRMAIGRSWVLILVSGLLLGAAPLCIADVDIGALPLVLQAPVAPATANPVAEKAAAAVPGSHPLDAKRLARDALAGTGSGAPPEVLLANTCRRLALLQKARQWGLKSEVDRGLLVSPEAVTDLVRLQESNPRTLHVAWHASRGTPRFISGSDLLPGVQGFTNQPTAVAAAFLQEHRALLKLDAPEAELIAFRVEESREGFKAVRFQQYYEGLEIWARDVIVRLDPSGTVIGFSGQYHPTPSLATTIPAIAAPLAASVASAELNARDGVEGREESTDLLIYPHDGDLRLAWRVTVSAGIAYRQEAFVDALSGEFLHAVSLVRYDGAITGSGLDLVGQSQQLELWQAGSEYAMINTTKQMFNLAGSDMPNNPVGAIWTLDANNTEGNQLTHVISTNQNDWTGQANAVSLATFAGYYYDYILATFGRNSFDNAGRTIKTVVNFGQNMNNAFWSGEFAVFGNGDNNLLSDLAGAMDVVCHELGHAIDEHTANFVYEFQPGSIDESYADIFGSLVEWHIEGAQGDWLLAEDVYTPGTPGDAMRNMEDPSSVMVSGSDPYPSHMDQYWNLSADQDHGGVHINNMIPSLAFVNVSKAVGRDKAEQVWYWALCNCLNRNSQFVDLRLGAIQAAEQLYPAEPAVLQAVTDAFDGVGVEGGGGTPDPPDLPDNEGDNFLAIMDIATGIIYRAPPDASSFAEIGLDHPMGGGGRPSFSDDGAWFVWVGEDKHIYIARSDGTDADQLSVDPEWWSVALSSNARYLAATTFENDGRIYVFDLEESANSGYYELYSQNDGGGTPSNVVYADVMEFTVEGDYILYDALNSAQIGGTTTYDYWDINMLRRTDGTCFRVFQTLPQDQHIGNPTLAQNQDNLIAFDYIVADTVLVQACNLQTGEVGLVTNNFSYLGRPTFSGDDTQIYYQYPVLCEEQYVDGVWSVSLEADGITGAGDDAPWGFCSIGYPVWFTIGARPAAVLLLALDAGWTGREVALQWQVTDPTAFSGFHVECGRDWEGPYERRTIEPIPAGTGNTYDFVDHVLATSDVLFYRVIGVQPGGMHTELGRLQILRGEANAGPRRPALLPNSPNPFGEVTALRFVLPAVATSTRTSLSIYDLQGRLVARPVAGELLGAGEHRVHWEGRDLGGIPLATGEYYMRLQIGGHLATGRISVIR